MMIDYASTGFATIKPPLLEKGARWSHGYY